MTKKCSCITPNTSFKSPCTSLERKFNNTIIHNKPTTIILGQLFNNGSQKARLEKIIKEFHKLKESLKNENNESMKRICPYVNFANNIVY